jgi:hypothetical protein
LFCINCGSEWELDKGKYVKLEDLNTARKRKENERKIIVKQKIIEKYCGKERNNCSVCKDGVLINFFNGKKLICNKCGGEFDEKKK